ncbi:hypothetical protein HPB48_005001 [Haemaphysalis longicornis]|uniref:Ig-like domain-containing protein n=1 Tax=Haemaphysalis longicornis TaxID=44386 RepID=A0A9J6GFL3_HAELO|nr:hypothetical protein HPB48_005001 [Haemaphysalis longicornis]
MKCTLVSCFLCICCASTEERYSVLETGELVIHRTNMADSERTYRCRVRNTVSGSTALSTNAGRAIVVDVGDTVAPRFALFRKIVRAAVGRSVDLPCVVAAFPPANVTALGWTFQLAISLATSKGKVNGILTFEEVKIENEGVYICIASNDVAEVRAEANLIITEPPGVALTPNYQVVEPGMPATLNCTSSSSKAEPSTISWLKNGKPLSTDARVQLDGTRLTIKPVKKADAGMYQCLAGDEALGVVQSSAEISVAGNYRTLSPPVCTLQLRQDGVSLLRGKAMPPTLTQTFYQKNLRLGDSFSLQCQCKGRPLPSFTWERNREPLHGDHRARVTSIHVGNQVISVLNVSRATSDDSGLYGCTAANEEGSASHWARVNVHGKLFVHRPHVNVSAVPGQDVTLQCLYGGYPVDTVSWHKGDTLLPRSGRQNVDNDGNLRIRNFQGSVDAGEYTCIVKAHTQEVRVTTQLILIVPPVIDDHFFPETITVDEGSRSRLLCSVSKGDGPLRFQWFKDGRPLTSVPDGSVQYSDDSAMIKFRKMRFRDRGQYTCFATNDAAADNRTTDVIVNVSPRVKVTPQNKTVTAGSRVVFDCSAEGFPTPLISWQKMGLTDCR